MANQTANLDAAYISQSQSQPEVTANSGFDVFDGALGSLLLTAMTDADYTLNTSASPNEVTGYMAYKFTGTLTAGRNIIIPVDPLNGGFNHKLFAVWNATSGGHAITLKTSSGSGIAVAASSTVYTLCYCDGTNVVAVGSGSGSSITLQTNGTNNGSQSLLNLVAGSNITIVDNGSGSITISATGGGGSGSGFEYLAQLLDVMITSPTDGQSLVFDSTSGKWINETISGTGIDLQTNGSDNTDQTKLNLIAGSNVTLTPDGSGGVTIAASGGGGGGGIGSLIGARRTAIMSGYTFGGGSKSNFMDSINVLGSEYNAFTGADATHATYTSYNNGSANTTCGWYGNGPNNWYFGNKLNMLAVCNLLVTTHIIMWVGLFGDAGSTGGTSTPSGRFAAFRYSTAVSDTNFQAVCRNGSSSTVVDTGVAADTATHRFLIIEEPGVDYKFYIDDNLVATITTDLPTGSGAGYQTTAAYETSNDGPPLFGITQVIVQSNV